jgi:uncharacterized integral membrane protein
MEQPKRKTGEQPFYRKPAAVAWAVIVLLALLLALFVFQVG